MLNYLSSNSTLNIHDLETSNQLHLTPHYNQAGFGKSPSAESAHLSYMNLVKRNGRGCFTAQIYMLDSEHSEDENEKCS